MKLWFTIHQFEQLTQHYRKTWSQYHNKKRYKRSCRICRGRASALLPALLDSRRLKAQGRTGGWKWRGSHLWCVPNWEGIHPGRASKRNTCYAWWVCLAIVKISWENFSAIFASLWLILRDRISQNKSINWLITKSVNYTHDERSKDGKSCAKSDSIYLPLQNFILKNTI